MEQIKIKNMVCDRCIFSVQNLLNKRNIPFVKVDLGTVILEDSLDAEQKNDVKEALNRLGFELLEDETQKYVEAVKNAVVELVTRQEGALKKFTVSAFIQETIAKDYKTLSALFSAQEGQTIEQFVIAQKIERVKELISYNELSISEIADKLHYSSVAHLSNQFKKITGLTPSQYKTEGSRKALDKI